MCYVITAMKQNRFIGDGMKDNLFSLLMHFFEKSLSQILGEDKQPEEHAASNTLFPSSEDFLHFKAAQKTSIRVFTPEEQIKLTKASYQFLLRMLRLEIISTHELEIILNDLIFSESTYVTLEETKWTIRNKLAEKFTANQLAFLDLVLYQQEDQLSRH